MKRTMAAVVAVLMCLSLAACAKTADLSDKDKQARVADAKTVIQKMEQGDFTAVFAKFDKSMQTALPETTLKAQWTAIGEQYGSLSGFLSDKTETSEGYLRVVLVAKFKYAALTFSVVYDANGKIAGLQTAQAYNVDDGKKLPEGLSEENVNVVSGSHTLPGKLTLPKGTGSVPAVVIVHGSGPSDKDGSMYNLKPYRDIAWGLAQKGIAVLRYDKRSLVYQSEMAKATNVTVRDESIEDAVSAVALLRKDARIDANRVYVLGHSLGGMLLPRIQAEANANGLIFVAASARSLPDQYERQIIYLAGLSVQDGSITQEQADATIAQVKTLVNNIRNLKPDSTLGPEALLGVPRSYWLDLQGYDPVAAARSTGVPMLFLQGERDYQVTMDDFALWKTLSDIKGTVFMTFETLGHLFTPGGVTPSAKDYLTDYIPFDATAINAMASFIKK
jgi:hypothetical protein